MMDELEKSDSLVVPKKSANKTGLLVAESMEGSGGIKRNADVQSMPRTLCRLRCVPGARLHTWGR
jgi:RNA-directed DNA polymerase